jgi:hypothetical protein
MSVLTEISMFSESCVRTKTFAQHMTVQRTGMRYTTEQTEARR